jgi:glycosyltransferase involved in cell wall biosynthesis
MAGGDLATLRAQTLAEILVLSAEGAPMPVLPPGPGIAHLTLDLGKFSADLAFQKETCDTLQTFAPDLLINGDPGRHPAWDLMAEAAGAMVAVAWQAPVRDLDSQVAQWLDRSYTRILPKGAPLLPALGLDPVPESVIYEGPMKLNLGCGLDHMPGWVNVDKFPASSPDVVHDLECFPWPFADGAAEEVLLKHVMEHLGRDSDTFLGIMKELYRVCAPGAQVRIVVPHPRHQDFLQDPTHVRPVLPETFQHFSLAVNDVWGRLGLPGTPLAKYLSLDFEGVSTTLQLDPLWEQAFREGRVTREGLDEAMRERNNVVQSTEILLRAVKPFGGKVPVRWEGAFFTYHSLAHVNRQLCLEIQRGGQVDLSILPTESVSFGVAESPYAALGGAVHFPLVKAAVHVRHQWPPVFDPPVQGAWVMIQPWEFGGIPSEWVEPMRDQLDEIWVPSTWVRDCYVASGIPADRVLVVPNGVDTEVFRPEGGRYPLATGKSFKFLFLGGTILRKGIDLLLAAYLRAFRAADDVCLVIKGQGGEIYQGSELSGMLERIRQEDPQAPEIEYIVESIDEGRVADLYRACDVFVMPYRGEGFGLPIAEAMASGLPVIVTARGAADDFVKEEWAWLIPSERTSLKMVDGYHPSQAGFWLEEPDLAVLAGHLRHAFEHPGEGRTKGRNARAFATANLGWQGPAALVAERLRALASVRPRRESPPEKNQGSEAFLLTVDWSNPLWVEVLLSYVQAFTPGEPVALVLPWASQETSLEAAQAQVLGILQGAGWTTFPDVILVDRPGELPGILAKFTSVQDIAEGLQGAYGTRLDQARRLLAQN